MNPLIEQVMNQDRSAYQDLPVCLRHLWSEREWSFLTDSQKADLIRSETEPEA